MRTLWAMCASAVAISALSGVLLGFYLDGRSTQQKGDTPASTWVSGKPSKSSTQSSTPSSASNDKVVATSDEATTTAERATTNPPAPPDTTEPPPAAPPPPVVKTTTTTAAWPCSPLNPLPPPSCDN